MRQAKAEESKHNVRICPMFKDCLHLQFTLCYVVTFNINEAGC